MSIENKLNYLSETKDKIKNAIISKGGVIDNDTTFRDYADIINDLPSGGSSEWTPDPDWWDIETILKNDTENYLGKTIILYSNADDFTTITLNTDIVAVRTSDGSFYTSNATHTWDRSKDKVVASDLEDTTPQYATRYIIFYHNKTDVAYTYFNSYSKNSLYIVFKCNLTKISGDAVNGGLFYSNYALQFFKFLDDFNLKFGTNFSSFCSNCSSLTKLPDVLDVSNGTNFSSFCSNCYSLTKLPDVLDVSNGTNFNNFCYNCFSLTKLPDVLDVSNGTNFSSFCLYCYSLTKLPDVLDVSNGTIFNSFCSNCYSLTKLPDVLDVSNGTNFSSFCSNCSSLTKLPDVLDVSNGTNFSSFCLYCYSLTKLPDVLDVSNGKTFSSFGIGLRSLTKANIKLGKISITTLSTPPISIPSLRYIAENAPTLTTTATLTIGSNNITRAGGSSGEIIQMLVNKGWTVN